jgi:alpha-tubulin suppressor-like RCC1 family protein
MRYFTFSSWKLLLCVGICTIFYSKHSLGQNLQISGGNNFSSVVCNQQVVNVSGYNKDGQLGVDATGNPLPAGAFYNTWQPVSRGTLGSVPVAVALDLLPAIRQADAGSGGHLLGLDCAQNVWGWGLNDEGQLGRGMAGGTHAQNSVPMRVLKGAQTAAGDFLSNIVYVSGGNNSSFAIEGGTGRVLSWGSNDHGQLGDGTVLDRLTPVYVLTGPGTYLTNIIQIEGGDDCTYALDASGHVWSWGITHDGAYEARNLGRPSTGEVVAAPGGGRRCIPYAGRVMKGTNNNNDATTDGFLNNIISLSGGDAHAIALDNKGMVWSWGGDWATGQLGQGNGGQYNYKAGRVVDVNVTAATGPFLGGGVNNPYKAIAIAAGQASSAVVLQDSTDPGNLTKNRVVVFGSNGLYEYGNMVTASGTLTCTGNNRFSSGVLGRGSCNSASCGGQGAQDENTNDKSYEYPVFVETASGVPLSGVSTVSDGDAWYFATNDVGGNAVSWGWNRRGEQATGSFSDRCYATPLTLPTSCAFDHPCPEQPDLPADFSTCPVFSYVLNSQVFEAHSTYNHRWYRRNSSSDPWVLILGEHDQTYTVTSLGQYKVEVYDTRTSVAFLCAPCPVRSDSITISEIPSPYTTDGCSGATASTYTLSTPINSKVKWYTSLTGGTPLNPIDSNATITVDNVDAPVTAACGPGRRALFAEDIGSTTGFLFPTGELTPTEAQITSAMGCATLSANSGNDAYLGIQVFKNVKLTSVSAYFKSSVGYSVTVSTGTVNIYTNSPNSYWNGSFSVDQNSSTHVVGSPVAFTTPTIPPGGTFVKVIPLNVDLTPGIYWIRVNGEQGIQPYFNCSPAVSGTAPGKWTTPIFDNAPGNNTIAAVAAKSPASYSGYSSKGAVFDLKFETGTGYSCGRVLVCQSSTSCPTPVELLYFTAEKQDTQVELNWATISETNSDYFLLQRSLDGITWTDLGKVKAAGNSKSLNNYSFIDTNVPTGTVYYRFVEYDVDGKTQHSPIEKVEFLNESIISVVPNPNNGQFTVNIQSASEEIILTLTNSLGQPVYQTVEQNKGNVQKQFNFPHLSKGVYYLSVKTDGDYDVVKIVIE